MNNFEINSSDISSAASMSRELNGLINDRIMTDRSIKSQQNKWNEMLKGTLGEDIKSVLSGEKKVKLPFKMKAKYWFNNLLNNITKII